MEYGNGKQQLKIKNKKPIYTKTVDNTYINNQNVIVNTLVYKELGDNRNFWIQANSGIGKTTIILKTILKNCESDTLIICNKWNLYSWYNKCNSMINKLENKSDFSVELLDEYVMSSDLCIEDMNENNRRSKYNIYLLLNSEINSFLQMLNLADNFWNRIVIDELTAIQYLPKYENCFLITDLNSNMDNYRSDIFYKQFLKDYELLDSSNLFNDLVKSNTRLNMIIHRYKRDEYLSHIQNLIYKEKKVLIITKKIPLELYSILGCNYNNSKDKYLVINSRSTSYDIMKIQHLYNSKPIDGYNKYNDYDEQNYIDIDSPVNYKKKSNNLYRFDTLIIENIETINSMSLIETDIIFILDKFCDIKQYVDRCDRITSTKKILEIYDFINE